MKDHRFLNDFITFLERSDAWNHPSKHEESWKEPINWISDVSKSFETILLEYYQPNQKFTFTVEASDVEIAPKKCRDYNTYRSHTSKKSYILGVSSRRR